MHRVLLAVLALLPQRCAPSPAASLALPLRLVQFADLHLGEAEGLDWGPAQDRNSTRVMQQVLAAELPRGVGLVVYSGDQVTGNNIAANATAYLRLAFAPTADRNLSFASIYGNHDDAPLDEPGQRQRQRQQRRLSATTRAQLLAFERATWPALSLTCGEAALGGCPRALAPALSNYALVLRGARGGAPRAALYFLDSGGGTFAETLPAPVTDWLAATGAAIGPVPSLVFVHIPPPEYGAAAGRAGCEGLAQDGVTPTQAGANALLATLAALGGVRAVSVGHDHGNAWCCPGAGAAAAANISLCYGRHTGYGVTATGREGRACLSWQRTPARAMGWPSPRTCAWRMEA